MNNFFSNYPEFNKVHKSPVDTSYWDTVRKLYDDKKYKEAAVGVLKYANPVVIEKYGTDDMTEFSIPHGSITVRISINDETFKVEAPFLEAPEQNLVPFYRHVAQLNFSPLNLANIKLVDGSISFYYECPIALCDPYKIWDVLYDICIHADAYDDDFIEKFKAKHIIEPEITRHSPEKLDEIYNSIVAIAKEGLEYIGYFDQKGWGYFGWDVITSSLMKIDCAYNPQGYLKTEIEKQVDYQMKSSDSEAQRISNGKAFLDRLINWEKEKLQEDLYEVEVFMTQRRRADAKAVKDVMQKIYERAKNEYGKGDFLATSLSVKYIFYYLLYNYNVDEKYSNSINNSIQAASGKTWKEAASYLWTAIDDIMNDRVKEGSIFNSNKSNSKKGFFASLFKS